MSLIYCDHNFLVSLFSEAEVYKDRLRTMISEGVITFVFSMWHWVEMSKDRDDTRALALAEFADSLSPGWLRDRVSLHREHVMEAFCGWLGIAYRMPPAVVSRREMLADLHNQPVASVPDIGSREFVQRWRARPNSLQPIIAAHQNNMQSFGWLRAHLRRVTRERDGARRAALRRFLPARTPAGLEIDSETRARFLQECNFSQCGTLAVEVAISERDWHFLGQMRWQHFIDWQHVVPALPHVDAFATNDRRIARLVKRVRPDLPFPTAQTLTKELFDSRYM